MRICIPRVQGRGAGLGNELIPWAKAFIASQELGASLMHPAWGLNKRGYRRYFATSRFDWMLPRVLGAILPTYTFTENDYRQSGELDFGAALRVFARRNGLLEKGTYILFLEGMWGGYESIAGAKDFLRGVLHTTRYTQANLYDLHRRLDGEKLQVAIHMRQGDFIRATENTEFCGKFNVCLPLEWYVNVCRSIRSAIGTNVEFILFTDGDESALAEFIAEFQPVTTLRQSNADCSDLLAMTVADLLVCSVSSYSMWAAFLSSKPYLWFQPNLQEVDGFLSIWGHEPAQLPPDGLTARNVMELQQRRDGNPGRGVPVGVDGQLPELLIQRMKEAIALKSATTDLIRYGATRMRN
jgi:hypothetical protein